MSREAKAAEKAAKKARRDLALSRMDEIREVAHKVRVNDPAGVHVTVWLSDTYRAEWWPGAGKWETREGFSQTTGRAGSFDAFKAWVAANRRVDDPEDDFDLIERVDD